MVGRNYMTLMVIVVCLGVVSPLHGMTLENIMTHNSLANEYETLHTKWAKPYASGPVRALFIVEQNPNINGLPLRRVVEIMQRFDISGHAVLVMPAKGDAYAIIYAGGSGVYGGEVGEARLTQLLEATYDVYVVIGAVMGHLPDAARRRILDRVSDGAGMALLYAVGDEDAPLLARFEEREDTPEALAALGVRCFDMGSGRIASLTTHPAASAWNGHAPTQLQQLFGFGVRRDLYYEVEGRVLFWAAGRAPPVNVQIDRVSDVISFDDGGRPALRIRWMSHDGTIPSRLVLRIRHEGRDGQSMEPVADISTTTGSHDVSLPYLPAGNYWLQVIAEGETGVVGWAIEPFEVIARQHIVELHVDRETGEAGDPITGRVRLSGVTESRRILRIQAVDRHGRVVVRQQTVEPDEEVSFTLPVDAKMPAFMGVEATIVQRERDVCRGYWGAAYKVTRRRQDRWNFILWGRLYTSNFLELAEDMLAANGVTSRIETSHVPWWYMTRAGMNYTPYCGSGLYRLLDSGPQEPSVDEHGELALADGCWNDQPAISERLRQEVSEERDYRGHGVLIYSMGDEVAVLGSCLHPSCWATYQQWLEGEYATIDALNASWGSSYMSFSEIEPLVDWSSLAHLESEQKTILRDRHQGGKETQDARKWILTWANNAHSSIGPTPGSTAWQASWRSYPRYIDRRSFQYWNFANHCRRFGDAARAIDPKAVWGVEGSDIYLDADIDMIVRHTGWWMPYGGENGETTNEVIRSIAPKGYLHGHFIGGKSFWSSFLRGGNTQGKWRIDNIFMPGMQLKRDMRRALDSARLLIDGMGTLLNGNPGSEMLDDGIVMLHSMASLKMAKIADGPSYGIFRWRDDMGKVRSATPQSYDHEVNRRSHRAWHRNLRAVGVQFRYTTDGQIRRGTFDTSDVHMIILSQYEVIGPEEESMLRNFVARGGTLIADVRPGIYGARGKQRDSGVLDDLFGVRHLASAPVVKRPAYLEGKLGAVSASLKHRDLYVNPAIEVTTATALGHAGETPIGIVREIGAGRTILLNFTMWSFPKLAKHQGDDDALVFFETLLHEAGVRRPLQITDASGRRHRNIEAVRWRTGPETEVVALYGPTWGTWKEPNGEPNPLPEPFGPTMDDSVDVVLQWPEDRYVYEPGTGRHAVKTRAFSTTVKPFLATLVSQSRGELHAPVLVPTAAIVSRGGVMRFRVFLPQDDGGRALKVRVAGPTGEPAPWFDRQVIVRDGHDMIELPVAWNEAVGAWSITVTDLHTAKQGTAMVQVE